jgi:hypothetical protein
VDVIKLKFLRWELTLDYPYGPNAITSVVEGRQEGRSGSEKM